MWWWDTTGPINFQALDGPPKKTVVLARRVPLYGIVAQDFRRGRAMPPKLGHVIVERSSPDSTEANTRRMQVYACAMGSERSSTVRQIRSGQICAVCRSSLPVPQTVGEQLCARCRSVKTPLPRRVTVGSHEKVREMARRGGAAMSLDALQAVDHGIEIGRGGIWLELTDDQYRRLRLL